MPFLIALAISQPTLGRRAARSLVGVGALALVALAPSRANAQSGSIVDLGGGTIRVTAFNNNGQVILQDLMTTYVWKDGVSTPVVSDPNYPNGSYVDTINDSGMMGGLVTVLDGPLNDAAVWSSPTALTEIVNPNIHRSNGDIRAYTSNIVALNN